MNYQNYEKFFSPFFPLPQTQQHREPNGSTFMHSDKHSAVLFFNSPCSGNERQKYILKWEK